MYVNLIQSVDLVDVCRKREEKPFCVLGFEGSGISWIKKKMMRKGGNLSIYNLDNAQVFADVNVHTHTQAHVNIHVRRDEP